MAAVEDQDQVVPTGKRPSIEDMYEATMGAAAADLKARLSPAQPISEDLAGSDADASGGGGAADTTKEAATAEVASLKTEVSGLEKKMKELNREILAFRASAEKAEKESGGTRIEEAKAARNAAKALVQAEQQAKIQALRDFRKMEKKAKAGAEAQSAAEGEGGGDVAAPAAAETLKMDMDERNAKIKELALDLKAKQQAVLGLYEEVGDGEMQGLQARMQQLQEEKDAKQRAIEDLQKKFKLPKEDGKKKKQPKGETKAPEAAEGEAASGDDGNAKAPKKNKNKKNKKKKKKGGKTAAELEESAAELTKKMKELNREITVFRETAEKADKDAGGSKFEEARSARDEVKALLQTEQKAKIQAIRDFRKKEKKAKAKAAEAQSSAEGDGDAAVTAAASAAEVESPTIDERNAKIKDLNADYKAKQKAIGDLYGEELRELSSRLADLQGQRANLMPLIEEAKKREQQEEGNVADDVKEDVTTTTTTTTPTTTAETTTTKKKSKKAESTPAAEGDVGANGATEENAKKKKVKKEKKAAEEEATPEESSEAPAANGAADADEEKLKPKKKKKPKKKSDDQDAGAVAAAEVAAVVPRSRVPDLVPTVVVGLKLNASVSYDGPVNAENKPHGFGSSKSAGGTYVGEFQNGRPHGRGTFTAKDGSVYEGEMESGKKQGEGKLKLPNGDEYSGGFKSGRYAGAGTVKHATGEVTLMKYNASTGKPFEEGVKFSADGTTAWRLQDGREAIAAAAFESGQQPPGGEGPGEGGGGSAEITSEAAKQIAESIGLPVPPGAAAAAGGGRVKTVPRSAMRPRHKPTRRKPENKKQANGIAEN